MKTIWIDSRSAEVAEVVKDFDLLTPSVAFEISLSLWEQLPYEPLALASGLVVLTGRVVARR